MASRTTLNAKNFEALGPHRLAELLLEIVENDTVSKRRARTELFVALGPSEASNFIGKRLTAIGTAKSVLRKDQDLALERELEGYRRLISGRIANQFPEIGLELILQLLNISPLVIYRQNERPGHSERVFRVAAEDLRDIAIAAKANVEELAENALRIIFNDFDRNFQMLPVVLEPALGRSGLKHLKSRLRTIKQNEAARICCFNLSKAEFKDRQNMGLRSIAFAQNDVDDFIRLPDSDDFRVPDIANALAERLIAADRAEDALKLLDALDDQNKDLNILNIRRIDARILALEELGRRTEAQDVRLSVYHSTLSAQHLREYLKRLPDFEDIEVEERELDYAAKSARLFAAFNFLLAWPDFDRAAALVLRSKLNRLEPLSAVSVHLLSEFELRHPFAATLIYRSAININLFYSSHGKEKATAKFLLNCERLAPFIEDFGEYSDHAEFFQNVRLLTSSRTKLWRVYAEMRKELA